MRVTERAALLLLMLMVAAAPCANADPTADACEGVNKTLPAKDLHKIFGKWVLVWSVTDHHIGWDLLPNVSSSHVEFRLLADNHTIEYTERNMFTNKSCISYHVNMTMPFDIAESDHHHTLLVESGMVEQDEVAAPFNDSSKVDFYETCSDCLLMVYDSPHMGRYLLSYRRKGHQWDVERLKIAEIEYRKLSECLGFPQDRPVFRYDGAAELCQKTAAPEVAADHQ